MSSDNLEELVLSRVNVEDISSLVGLRKLKALNVRGCKNADPTVLGQLENLTDVGD